MSQETTPITGKLIKAGDMRFEDEQITGIVIECTVESLKGKRVPFYREVVILSMEDYQALTTPLITDHSPLPTSSP